MRSSRLFRALLALVSAVLVVSYLSDATAAIQSAPPPHTPASRPLLDRERGTLAATGPYSDGIRVPKYRKNQKPTKDEDFPDERAAAFYLRRTAGNPAITLAEAAIQRDKAAQQALALMQARPQGVAPAAFGSQTWQPLGPDPIVQAGRGGAGFLAMAGRVSALAIRSTAPYTIYLGAAQGGIWVSSTLTLNWEPRSAQFPTLAIGAIALAPSNEDIVYVGTGEGALSSDSYFGSGVMKSTDGGNTFTHISGNFFNQVSISRIVVHPTNPNHLYAATLRGRAGKRRLTPPNPSAYGIWESTNGGVTWTPRRTTTQEFMGATDLVIDPVQPNVLYASFWTEGIFKSTDSGATWAPVMNGLPTNANYADPTIQTRFALGISRPTAAVSATLYAGFDWVDTDGLYHPSTIWKSTNEGASWSETSTAVVGGYCGQAIDFSQCWYDNEIGVDPTNPNIVYALGLFNYDTGTGGIYRSDDGGATWVDLGYAQHPDFHAIAIRKDAPDNIVVGNDGGVWSSSSRGGRIQATDPITAVTWINLNGTVNQEDLTATGTGLQIAQFTSIAQHPTNNRVYGGTQDNGTMRKINTATSSRWYDFGGGDGGQVLVDPNNPNYVYGTYFGISPYRFDDGMATFFGNQNITNGITTTDRSEFYIPFIMDPEFTNRLYLGTFRVYRTDDRGDNWRAISPDLTSGCEDIAPNGARGCFISTLGATAGSPALYAGTEEGIIQLTTDAYVDNPTWTRVDKAPLPARPVQDLELDRSNYRIAYATFGGFNAGTPTTPGHVFKTTDGGQTWANISGNLPDVPVNSLVLDASNPNILYAGTDVGPFITTDGGTTWTILGGDFPIVTIWQLDLNPLTRRMVAGTHGRGAWSLTDAATTLPALQVRTDDAGVPVGPGSLLNYTLTVKNIGNAPATGVSITNPLPANTTFVAAGSGGNLVGNNVVWNGLTVPVTGSVSVDLQVRIAATGLNTGDVITIDGATVTSNEGAGATGSPHSVTLAPPFGLALTPERQLDGTRAGQVITYVVTLKNQGYTADSYQLTTSGNKWPTEFVDATTFTTPVQQTGQIAPGGTTAIGIRVSVPLSATNGLTDTATLRATSVGSPAVSDSATVRTIAVRERVLLVDNDGSFVGPDSPPDVAQFYTTAVISNGFSFNLWDITAQGGPPLNYMKAHKVVVWFTGTSYPGPLLPYEDELAAFLDGGGRLFMSGWDILDQAAGTTDFVHDYLHIAWDGTEIQNDLGTLTITAVPTNTVTAGMGTLPISTTLLGSADFSDQITPIPPALAAFRDDKGQPNALTLDDRGYRVVFLAFPFEAITRPRDRVELMRRSFFFFTITNGRTIYLPIVMQR